MKRKVIKSYPSPYPVSIVFRQGENVRIGRKFEDDPDWDNWFWCEGEHDNHAWVPAQYIDRSGESGTLNTAYDARELTVSKGQIVETFQEINGFAMARDSEGRRGWVPLKNLELDEIHHM